MGQGKKTSVLDRMRRAYGRLRRWAWTRRRRGDDAYDENPLPLRAALLAALSGLFRRGRRRDEADAPSG